jgi:DNA-binding MurR/RpiR family transcriptional regulator
MRQPKPNTRVKPGKLTIQEKIDSILEENRQLLQSLSDEAIQDFISRIEAANAIFCSAQGRSGYVLRWATGCTFAVKPLPLPLAKATCLWS